jgi:sulfur carrier protein ThiS
MNTTVTVNGTTYQIPNSKLSELITFLETNKVVSVLDNNNAHINGRTVING